VNIGVDSYSYHRLLGEVRPGEDASPGRFAAGSLDVVLECRRLGVDAVSLETCFLDAPEQLDAAALVAQAGPLELLLSWGHPEGLAFGADPGALNDLLLWIAIAPSLACCVVRLVAGGARLRGSEPISAQLERTRPLLARAAEVAESMGVALALENHADLTAAEMEALLEPLDGRVGVCLDTANALRVGDDPVAAARRLAPLVSIVHLKDCDAPGPSSNPTTGPRTVPYGEGVVDLEGVLVALAEARFSGPICIELGHLGPGAVDERALVAGGVAWLRTYDNAQNERSNRLTSGAEAE